MGSPAREAKVAEDWNLRVRIGHPVLYWKGAPSWPGRPSRTRTPAQVLGGHTAVVWVEGEPACIALTHVAPLPHNRTDETAYNELVADRRNHLRIVEVRKDETLVWHDGAVLDELLSYQRMVVALALQAWDGSARVFQWSVVEYERGRITRGELSFDGLLLFDESAAQRAANPYRIETRGRPDLEGSVRAAATCEGAMAVGHELSVKHQACSAVYCRGDFVGHVYQYSGQPRLKINDFGCNRKVGSKCSS